MSNGEAALEHKTRKQIYDLIFMNPGVSFSRIRNYFNLNESTLKYHLKYLERSKKVNSKREGRLRCYFCVRNNGFDLSQIPQMVLNQLNENQKLILNQIIHNHGIDKDKLLERTGLSKKTLDYNIDRLLEHKLIWRVKPDDEVGYEFITKELLREEIYNRLLLKLLKDEIDEVTFMRLKKKLESLDLDEIKI